MRRLRSTGAKSTISVKSKFLFLLPHFLKTVFVEVFDEITVAMCSCFNHFIATFGELLFQGRLNNLARSTVEGEVRTPN